MSGSGLQNVGIFAGLKPADRRAMEAELKTMQVRRGDVLVQQGDPADALYIVVSGRFEVHVQGRTGIVAEIGPGSPVGEIAFLAGGTRTATVIAARDSLVMRLGKPEFQRLCARAPEIWQSLTETLASRLGDTNVGRSTATEPVPRTIAIIPASGGPIPADFIERLRQTFARSGSTRVLTSRSVAEITGSSDVTSGAATAALNALEAEHDTVLYIADPELTAWSEKAIRQADQVLRIASAGGGASGPVPLTTHEALAERLVGIAAQRLVLLHRQRTAPRGTRAWLAPRRVHMHHHVALSDDIDIERLVRFIQGRAVGLVACGGGAFCAAHIGLYKALIEAGVVIDIMGGTSGGSAMAAAFAMGLDPYSIDQLTHEIFVTNGALRRYTWPRYSILDHTHFDRLLANYYAGIDIEDLWIPYFAISTNLSRYSLHRHRDGDLWTAVRASGSIPALLPPFYTNDGQMLVDGCLLDNVPVQAMHELKRGPNVVVAFEVPQLERFDVDYKKLPSRNDLLGRLLKPFGRAPLPDAPSLGSVLLRSLMANRQGFERHLRPDDLLLVPPLPSDMSILDWGRHSELMDQSYRWCRAEIARLSESPPAAIAGARPGQDRAIALIDPRSTKT